MKVSTQALLHIFGQTTYERANAYISEGRLSRLTLIEKSDDYISFSSEVEGTTNYQQKVSIELVDGELSVAGHCNCPVRYRCKHILTACLGLSAELANEDDDANQKINLQQQQWLEALAISESKTEADQTTTDQFLCYFLHQQHFLYDRNKTLHFTLQLRSCRPKKIGGGITRGRIVSAGDVMQATEKELAEMGVTDNDIAIIERLMALETTSHDKDYYVLARGVGAEALERALETGHCYWHDNLDSPIEHASIRTLKPDWAKQGNKYMLRLGIGENTRIIPTMPRYYFDMDHIEIGELENAHYNNETLQLLETAPVVNAQQAIAFTNALSALKQEKRVPSPISDQAEEVHLKPVPCLRIDNHSNNPNHPHFVAELYFKYGEHTIESKQPQSTIIRQQDDSYIRIARDNELEQQAVTELESLGLKIYEHHALNGNNHQFIAVPVSDFYDEHYFWPDFIFDEIPVLESRGWLIEQTKAVAIDVIEADWSASMEDEHDVPLANNNAWFDIRFDLQVGEERLPLAPMIAPLLQKDPDQLPEQLNLPIGDGRYARLPKERIVPYLATLKALFELDSDNQESFKVQPFNALLADDLDSKLAGAQRLRVLAGKLKDFSGIQAVTPAENLHATLRPYQQQGLNWLSFLREYQFNGILADDMGLGKTLQTLAHLQREKTELNANLPSLILAPTSLISNWRKEAEKFTPDLSVLVLHGDKRHSKFPEIEKHNVVITTYPLVTRDINRLQGFDFHYVVLDEAQAIKNPTTALAKAVRKLQCNHRLCLTGTPLENHLGELWSLFDFLMPGFLSSYKRFRKHYQTPIEKEQDYDQQKLLSKRLQPFMLRRSKSAVATELPPKTEIIQTVSLSEKQAQLYESVRVTMDKQVRAAIASQGYGRSHIQILDALLRLRQVCCDPRLLPLEQTKSLEESAKLDLLMTLLPEQLAEGRKILLFSQFTSMLSLIQKRLDEEGIDYSLLTGQTKKREEAIDSFKNGDVNLFLISLKAGGVGLNLTEADTVILYDPWWNPAVENQAIDRAHRIGQDKPVFVYKLIVENSLEEKMVAMQSMKQNLANAVYNNDADLNKVLSESDLTDLFAPLYG